MASWTVIGGTGLAASFHSPVLFIERAREWFIRGYRSGATAALEVRIYGVQADAVAGNANYCASGQIDYATLQAGLENELTLLNNGPQAPTWPTGSKITTVLDSLAAVGDIVWKCDLGKRAARAYNRVHRAMSLISQGAGYLTTPAFVEKGIRLWHSTEGLRPYLGVAVDGIRGEPLEVGASQRTTLQVVVLALLDTESEYEDNTLLLWDDIRRALIAIDAADADLPPALDDGPIWSSIDQTTTLTEKGWEWFREKGGLVYHLEIAILEDELSVTGG